ncbi:hypothetical protein [Halococcus sp. AFM35]|uniref:hypothetical protein n=1 Tax=Halococcus sp. AFM35 TaxID=3421653 RepID=UPI003EBDD376
MSTSTPEVVRRPSAKTAVGLFALVVGYLGALVGTVFYTWAGLHTLYRVPVLAIPVVGVLVVLAGGALVWAERA